MMRNILSWLGAPALAGALVTVYATPATAGDARYPFCGSNGFDVGCYSPSSYGYNLNAVSTGYYGGGSYREYYNFGRGPGILANYPGPLPGRGTPPDYRGSMSKHHTFDDVPAAEQPVLSPLVQGGTVARIAVEVPADADIWIEGRKTQSTGATRQFVSPPISKGEQFTYHIKARWNEDGKPVEQTQQVAVQAGETVTVGFPTGGKKEVTAAPNLFPIENAK